MKDGPLNFPFLKIGKSKQMEAAITSGEKMKMWDLRVAIPFM